MNDVVFSLAANVLELVILALVPVLLNMAIGAIRDNRARNFAVTAVAAAQQHIPDKDARYVYVAALLAKRFPFMRAAEVQALIEAAVLAIKQPLTVPVVPAPTVEQSNDDPTDKPQSAV